MSVTINSEDKRSIRAVEIASGAGQWLKVRTRDGRKFYGIPSQRKRGRYYLTTCSWCDCEDAQRWHPGTACKHQIAVRLYVELVKAEQARRASRKRVRRAAPRTAPVSQPDRQESLAARYDAIYGDAA